MDVLPAFHSVVEIFRYILVRKLCLVVLVDSFKWGRCNDKQFAMCTRTMDRDPHPHGATLIIYIKNIFNHCILLYNGDRQHRMLCPLLRNVEKYSKRTNFAPKNGDLIIQITWQHCCKKQSMLPITNFEQ